MTASSDDRGRRTATLVAVIARAPGTGSRASRRASGPPAADVVLAGQPGQGERQLLRPRRLDDQAVTVRVERDATDRVEADEGGRQSARPVGAHEHVARAVVHRVADRTVAAGRRQPAVDEDDHPLGEALDLTEDVRADDHRAPAGAELAEQPDQRHPLDRVGAVERLVEHEHLGVGDQRGSHLRALTHPLAEPVDAAVGRRRPSRPSPARRRARRDRSTRCRSAT